MAKIQASVNCHMAIKLIRANGVGKKPGAGPGCLRWISDDEGKL
jgi:hypothetical protein